MLLRFDKIQEIGRFASLTHKAPQFPRLALIYARNGYGKSTFCSIIRSAAESKPEYITARRRLGALKESTIQSQWQAHGTISFNNGKWNACPGSVYVFDQDYIQQNLHVGESVTRDHKRSLLRVVLGAKGVQLARVISELDADQRELTAKLAASEKAIRAARPSVANVATFCSDVVPSNIEEEITAAKRKAELGLRASTVQQKKDPAPIPVQPLTRIEATLARSIEDVTEKTAARVKEHIEKHNMQPHGPRWLKYGADHMNGPACPFCKQDTSQIDFVTMLRGYFSQAYTDLESDISDTTKQVQELTGRNAEALKRLLEQNYVDLEFWKTVCPVTIPHISPEELEIVIDGLSCLRDILGRKAASPHISFTLDDEGRIQSACDLIARYNQQIADCVELINEARDQVGNLNVAEAKRLLAIKEDLHAKLSEPLKSEVEEYVSISKLQAELVNTKKAAQEDLRKFTETVIKKRQNEINDLLENFGANFAITDTKASYIGREPNTDYSILIGPHKVQVGERNDQAPCFKTVLSAGDKFTLALALFITQVRSEPDLKDATIVFDDPFNSQDMHRQWETTSQIRSLSKEACQVVVLSHDPRFLQMIKKDVYEADHCSEYQLSCCPRGEGKISSWSSNDELKSIYVRQAERIREFATKGSFLNGCDAESLTKDLRPFLEDFLKARFPGRFGDIFLSDMAIEINKSGADDPMYEHVETFRKINEFSRGNMHGGASIPDPHELRAQCKRVVKVVGAY
jgi:wobble nucleotide-excising tRNase